MHTKEQNRFYPLHPTFLGYQDIALPLQKHCSDWSLGHPVNTNGNQLYISVVKDKKYFSIYLL